MTLIATYDVRLITLSIIIAIFGSYIALDLAEQAPSFPHARKLWLTGSTLALGTSIWAMHFIGMLAYELPIPIVYDLKTVCASMVVATVGAGTGLFFASYQPYSRRLAFVAAANCVGWGIVGMHLTAIAAMRVAAVAASDFKLMTLSIVVAIAGSGSALSLAVFDQTEALITTLGRKLGSALLMGAAISGMHYLAMAAVSFQPLQLTLPTAAPNLNNSRLAVLVGSATLTLLMLAFLTAFLSQRAAAQRARTEALSQSEARFRSLVQNASDLIAIITANGNICYLSPSIQRVLGYEPKAWLGKKALELLHPEEHSPAAHLWRATRKQKATNFSSEFRLQHLDGSWREFEVIVNNLLAEPSIAGVVATCREITQRKQAQRQLWMLQTAVEQSIDGIAVTDAEGKLIFVNPAIAQMHGYRPEELVNQHYSIFHTEEQMQQEVLPFMERVQQTSASSGELKHKRRDGTIFPTQKTVTAFTDGNAEPLGYAAIIRDITERKQVEAQLLASAFHDPLTNLANRTLLLKRLQQSLSQVKRQPSYLFAVLFLDLDRFKAINDNLGHTLGDQLLIAVANRLTACLRPNDLAARLGGDEFTILLEGIGDLSDVIRVAERIQTELKLPFVLGEQEVFTTASVGIALSNARYKQPEELLRDADTAMYRAKARGKACYEVFNPDMYVRAMARWRLENDLRRAIARQEFLIYYQPIVSLKLGKIIGFEALGRWQHPERGLLLPEEFIGVLEETELNVALDWWVLRQACQQMQQWQQLFFRYPPLTISVNFCSRHFAQKLLISQLQQVLQSTDLPAQSLKLEITESSILENSSSVFDTFRQIKALGISLVIDDFGTGYSSLERLRNFPLSILKIDRSFIASAANQNENSEIVKTIITLAHSLGLEVTAEGVETAEQMAQMQALGCEYGQGYFFSPPLNSQAATALIKSEN